MKPKVKTHFKSALQQGYVDEETGEVFRQTVTTEQVSGFTDVKLPIKHKLNNGNFIVLFQKSMYEIALNHKKFTRNELTLLIYFLGSAGLGNSIYVDYPTLMVDLELQRSNIVTAINSLTAKGIIIKAKAKGRSKGESQLMRVNVNFDQLNYNLAYNGKIKEFKKLKDNHPVIDLQKIQLEDKTKQMTIFDVDNV